MGNGAYRVLLSGKDYAESLITAEWLHDAMTKARAIDLTVIGTGYFKAAEQLLFALIRLSRPSYDKDSTLGDYATFYRDHLDQVLRTDVDISTKNYVREAIYEYSKLRNGYFHKDNIHDPKKIEEVRTTTFLLMYLLLGCQRLSDSDYASLGTPTMQTRDDFASLCEYISFHKDSVYCVEPVGYPEQWLQIIPRSKIPQNICDSETGSSLYYHVVGSDKCGRFSKQDAPTRIWAGKLDISYQESIHLHFEKNLLILEEGIYVGPRIVEEEDFTY